MANASGNFRRIKSISPFFSSERLRCKITKLTIEQLANYHNFITSLINYWGHDRQNHKLSRELSRFCPISLAWKLAFLNWARFPEAKTLQIKFPYSLPFSSFILSFLLSFLPSNLSSFPPFKILISSLFSHFPFSPRHNYSPN